MSKYRIYELAKEFDTTSKVIIDILSRNSMPAKNHMSSVDDAAKAVIDRTFARKSSPADQIEKSFVRPLQPRNPAPSVSTANAATPARVVAPISPTATGQNHSNSTNQGTTGNRPAFRSGQSSQTGSNRPPYPRADQARLPLNRNTDTQRPVNTAGSNPSSTANSNYQQRSSSQSSQRPAYNSRPTTGQSTTGGQYSQNRPYNNSTSGSSTGSSSSQNRPSSAYNRAPSSSQGSSTGSSSSQSRSTSTYNRAPSSSQGSSTGSSSSQNRPSSNYNRAPSSSQSRSTSTYNRAPSSSQGSSTGGSASQSRSTSTYNRAPNSSQSGSTGSSASQNRPAPNFTRPAASSNRGSNQSNYRSTGGSNQSRNASQNRNRPQNQNRHRSHQPVNQTPRIEVPKPTNVQIAETISVKDFAAKCNRPIGEIIKKLMMLGVMAAINQEIDFDTATLVGTEFGVTVEPLPPEAYQTEIAEIVDEPATLVPRSPVVTVMGHVDHGKTSLLDSIRKANVTASEAGGITQHIGAYQVNYQEKRIIFLDTPGHEAFTAMRARGAQVTDISVLVVAADDGVMPQTIEAINHSKSAKVPIIVAINKMDRPGANADRVKQQLSEQGLIPEDWGGDTIMVPVSAQKKTGITDLLEMILLVAEIQELKANPNRSAYGTIIEAELDKGRGPVATVLIQKGTLHVGDSIIAGTAHGKVRAMINDRGEKVKKAGPSTPVEVLGLSDVPLAGDILEAVDEKIARLVADKRIAKKRTEDMQNSSKVSLDDLFQQIKDGNLQELNIVVKADVQGSIEALRQALVALKNDEVRVNVIHAGVGAINESDVMLASASNTLIIGFNVRPDTNARKAAEAEKVDIRTYRVIYDAINDVQAAITGMLAPTFKEVILGRVEVRKVFNIPQGVVAGSYVLEGKISNKSQVRIIRDGVVVHEGLVEGLKRFKDDAKEVAAGYECGVSIEKFRDIKEGDIFEAFVMEEVKRSS
jgi:translation initiation factor IF-2